MTERILLPQLITVKQFTETCLLGRLNNLTITAFPTGVKDLQMVLFDVLVKELYMVNSTNNYICTDDVLEERGLTPNEAYEQAVKNLQDLPHLLITAPSGLAQVIAGSPSNGTDIYASVRCFVKPIVDSLIDTSEKRFISFPNLNVPFIYHPSLSEMMAQTATNEVFSKEDDLCLTPRVYVLENGVVRDI